jgi:threo-3-hydroxy-L-aspartate ammonia-lyase
VGVEPGAGDDTQRSLAAGVRVEIAVPRTIADAMGADVPGELTFPINRRLVDEVVLVSDDELRAGMRFLFDRLKVVAEPTGASPVAALLAGRLAVPGVRVGVIVSGGNVDVARFCELLA